MAKESKSPVGPIVSYDSKTQTFTLSGIPSVLDADGNGVITDSGNVTVGSFARKGATLDASAKKILPGVESVFVANASLTITSRSGKAGPTTAGPRVIRRGSIADALTGKLAPATDKLAE